MEFFVFDTNILLSAVFNENSTPGIALKKARTIGVLLVSEEIIAEYITVFSREKFNKWLSLKTRIDFIENIISHALPIQVTDNIIACRDPKDDKYLSLAKASQADCIVSGDQDLLILNPFENIPILNAADFLTALEKV
jgi:putative PIN family toxin of toxin-antitoxin system